MDKELKIQLAKYSLITGDAEVCMRNGVITIGAVVAQGKSVMIPKFTNVVGDGTMLHGLPDSEFSVRVPREVSAISAEAFMGSNVSDVVIEAGAFQTLGSACFADSRISTISLHFALASIGALAFNSCSNLREVIIPETVTSIGKGAFAFSGLVDVTIPENVCLIGDGILLWCRNLDSVRWNAEFGIPDLTFNSSSLKTIAFGRSVDRIGNESFYNCQLSEIVVPPLCKLIGLRAFSQCSKLKKIDFSELMDECYVSDEAFSKCDSLEYVRIPEGVVLGDRVFEGCTSLKRVLISFNSDVSMCNDLFRGCTGLKYIRFGDGVSSVKFSRGSFPNTELLEYFLDKDMLGVEDHVFIEVPKETYDYLIEYNCDWMETDWYKIVRYNCK